VLGLDPCAVRLFLNIICIFAAIVNIMGRILAIDYGRKRIGLAVTDPMQIIGSPLTTIHPSEFDSFLQNYLKTEIVDEFVVGYPVQMNNQPSESVVYLNPFIKKLERLFPEKPIHLVDERFTSKIALRTIIGGGVKKKDRRDKTLADRISASLILQAFLDKRSFIKGNEKVK
jgi:putative holliday junction resolvase